MMQVATYMFGNCVRAYSSTGDNTLDRLRTQLSEVCKGGDPPTAVEPPNVMDVLGASVLSIVQRFSLFRR